MKAEWHKLLPVLTAMCIAVPAARSEEQGSNGDCVNDGAGVFNNAHGQFTINGGQISGAGATLFVDFFRAPASTNDFVDVDNDGIQGFSLAPPFVDQLGTAFVPGLNLTTYWNFQYRSVGSVNGFNEFVQNQLCNDIPTSVPGEAGVFNGFEYATGGLTVWAGPFGNASGTPFEPCEIEFSFLDVPSVWAVQVPEQVGQEPRWNADPLAIGYGLNPITSSTGYVSQLQPLSRDCDGPGGNAPVMLNQNFGAPDADTIYDFIGAVVPVAYISNRGTGLQNVRYSEMQHLFTTGRMPNGENLVAATRSVGSGTRNAIMNSTGIDTSWGRGDNTNNENAVTGNFNVGPSTQAPNAQGSSQIEQAVLTHRLAVGYTGLAGPSRAAQDAQNGLYEILNICKDVDGDGNPLCDCTPQACAPRMGCSDTGVTCIDSSTCNPGESCIANADADTANNGYVRPTISSVLDNCDACCGYTISGNGSFVTRGNPDANRNPLDPDFNAMDPALDNDQVANYIINIEDSINAFAGNVQNKVCSNDILAACTVATQCKFCTTSGNACTTVGMPGDCPIGEGDCAQGACVDQLNMPGQFLATTFFLPAGMDCIQSLTDGMDFSQVTNPLNQKLQTFARLNNGLGIGGDTPAFGSANQAGRIPTRNTVAGYQYSDGRSGGAYVYWNNASFVTTSGNNLAQRNRVAGDFDEDVDRDLNDFDEMVTAYYTPRTYQQSPAGMGAGNPGNMATDNAIPEIIGDFNGDGSFTKEDLRYAADGLAMVGGALDRKAGAIAVDTQIQTLAQPFPWADTRRDLLIPPAATGTNPTFMAPKNVNAAGDEFNATGTPYKPGDFRCDVAGGHAQQCIAGRCELDGVTCVATLCTDLVTACPGGDVDCPSGHKCRYGAPECIDTAPVAGADPRGWDGKCDDKDINYVLRNQGSWIDLDEAVFIDASADMDGDLTAVARVDYDDVDEILEAILLTMRGDLNLDGLANAADQAIFFDTLANDPTGCNAAGTCGWANGDCTGDGIVDAADLPVCFPGLAVNPPAAPAPPLDRLKNRYVSFAPNNAGVAVAFRVQKLVNTPNAGRCTGSGNTCTGPGQGDCAAGQTCISSYPAGNPGGDCWVQVPQQTANAVPAQNTQFEAVCGATPVFRVWTESVVHVYGCPIIPTSRYEIYTNLPGPVETPIPFATRTVPTPALNSKLGGDIVGVNNGAEWTAPNSFSNVNDALALLAIVAGNGIRPAHAAANLRGVSAGDGGCVNGQVNTGDLQMITQSISGFSYGPPSTTQPVDPAACAPCPGI